jgi:hypothetical protein
LLRKEGRVAWIFSEARWLWEMEAESPEESEERRPEQIQDKGADLVTGLWRGSGGRRKTIVVSMSGFERSRFSVLARGQMGKARLAGAGRCAETGLAQESCWPATNECGAL